MSETVTAESLSAWIETLPVVSGEHEGDRWTVLDWQHDLIADFLEHDETALSMGRGNGKSAIVSAVGCAVLTPAAEGMFGGAAGPLHAPGRQVIVVSGAFEQARTTMFADLKKMLGERCDLSNQRVWRCEDNSTRAIIEHRPSGALVRVLSANPKSAHGARPSFLFADEPAQWQASGESMMAALRTSLGKVPNSRLVWLGTRPADRQHFFDEMMAQPPPDVAVHLYAADRDGDPFDEAQWHLANPSLRHLPHLERRIAKEARAAESNPSLLPSFRALRLNLGVADTQQQHLIDPEVWLDAETDAADRAGPCVFGIDLGTSAAMSAVAACWPETGRLEVVAAFPSEPSLAERGRFDGVGALYQHMADAGDLVTLGGKATDVRLLLAEAIDRFGRPDAIVSDRWRRAELQDVLLAVRIRSSALIWRGHGFRDGAEDVELFRRSLGEGVIAPVPSLLLRSALAEARTVHDAAGNAKLAKAHEGGRRRRSRDDAAAAAILAVAEAARHRRRSATAASGPRVMI